MALKKSRVEDLAHDIANTIEHGECFYEAEELDELLEQIADLERACVMYRAQIIEEAE